MDSFTYNATVQLTAKEYEQWGGDAYIYNADAFNMIGVCKISKPRKVQLGGKLDWAIAATIKDQNGYEVECFMDSAQKLQLVAEDA